MTKTEEEKIIKEHDSRIRITALSFLRLSVSMDDLVQEGRIALLLAARNWQPDRGASVWTYARRFVLGAMFAAVGEALASPRLAADELPDQPDNALSPEERVVLLDLLDRLSPRELQIVRTIYSGETLEESASDVGLSTAAVWYIRDGAIAKMREAA